MAEVQQTNSRQAGELAQKFVQFVMMHAQNVLFVLGRIPTPDGRTAPPNLEAAKMLIDQLEVIKEKTKGNLGKQEAAILDEALSSVQLAFVEASGGTPASMMPERHMDFGLDAVEDEPVEPAPPAAAAPAAKPAEPAAPPAAGKPEDEPKKKYFKSYG